jgi:hypothetical protein
MLTAYTAVEGIAAGSEQSDIDIDLMVVGQVSLLRRQQPRVAPDDK